MSSTATKSGLVIIFLSMTVVQGQQDWGVTYSSTQICALKGMTVDIPCTYIHPPNWGEHHAVPVGILWFTRMNGSNPVDLRSDPDYTGRVEYHFHENGCTLRITDLTESDAAEYKIRLIMNHQDDSVTESPGVTLSVTDPHVTVINSTEDRAELKCHSSCHPSSDQLSYIWYRNGRRISKETASVSEDIYPADSFACALKGHEDFHSPAVCVKGENCNRVVGTESGHSTLRITDLRLTDSAQYHFKFKSNSLEWHSVLPATTLTVTALQVQVNTESVHRTSDHTELKCHSSCSPAGHLSYIWFKNGEKIQTETATFLVRLDSVDSYACALRGYEDFPSPPVCIHGQYCNNVIYMMRRICAPEGSSVDISCSYNSYWGRASKFWFSPERSHQWKTETQPEDLRKDSKYEGRIGVLEAWGGQSILRISKLRESDSAEYRFKFKSMSFEWRSSLPGTNLTVTGSWTSTAAGMTLAIVLAIIFLALFIFIRKKHASKQTPETEEEEDVNQEENLHQSTQEDHDDLHYSSVQFITNQPDSLYSNIRPAQHHGQEQEEGGDVNYAAIMFKWSAPRGVPATRLADPPQRTSSWR
ncbi:Down syndrome cell adhesion molecule-like protein Dscam2 [Xyrichtys novacula]|uniref:Down syndrome cell adhesion molecule-like protein Dscam2 n=1 Tax=Xyrichtys novacula TaxID=13765 RepID=A0AAV1EW69_XYRNO|nr:Down syndrome cell adhesion molecule-like protein Dscam2 [Xyrichtys novacula]